MCSMRHSRSEVSEHGRGAARVRVTTIIPAQAERQRKILRRFPGVLGEQPPCARCGIPDLKFPNTVVALREYGLPLSSQRRPSVNVRFFAAFQVSSASNPHVLDAAFHDHSTGCPVVGSYITPPSVVGWSWTKVRRLANAKVGCECGELSNAG